MEKNNNGNNVKIGSGYCVRLLEAFFLIGTVLGILYATDIIYPGQHYIRAENIRESISNTWRDVSSFLGEGIHLKCEMDASAIEGLEKKEVDTVVGNSYYEDVENYKPYEFHYDNLIDGNPRTTWQTDKDGTGKGAYVKFRFYERKSISVIRIYSGNWMKDDPQRPGIIYENNIRPQKIEIRIKPGMKKYVVDMTDKQIPLYIDLREPVETNTITLTILEVWEGTDSNKHECCISEVEFWGKSDE